MSMSNPPYVSEHWEVFAQVPLTIQGLFGRAPASFDAQHGLGIEDLTGFKMPDKVLTRAEVRQICRDAKTHVLAGYAVAMAWGLQGAGKGARHARTAWEARELLEQLLSKLRNKELTRGQAYALFRNNRVAGLGPAYFTKLIYFFHPKDEVDRYIMDQWTAKSVNLLTGKAVVKVYADAVHDSNTEDNYEGYCAAVDELAKARGCTGEELEQALFSSNASGRQERGVWRQHVYEHWEAARPR